MKVKVNDEIVELEDAATLSELLAQLSRHQPGIALAVNHTIVPRQSWAQCRLTEGDDILVFQAIAGG
ncbi:sulfur carrier protein ThiS [Pantoea osteomyelitidis]|uniref:Sulfur carrier protein ThiS n=1 Tax=Pantoea osteomyelitidis TaxID=3230026 RepID=A0ABW7Q1G7_9GAMM